MMVQTNLVKTTPEQAVFIIMAGKELGMGPMWSVQNLKIVEGHVSASAEGQLALIRKNCAGVKIEFLAREVTGCRLRAKRPNEEWQLFEFSLEDAKRANLAHKPNWLKYPRAMLHARCISEMARAMFPDAIAGISSYTPDEIRDFTEMEPVMARPTIPLEQKPQALAEPKRSIREIFRDELKISEEILCDFLGVSELKQDNLEELRKIYSDIKEGRMKPEDLLIIPDYPAPQEGNER